MSYIELDKMNLYLNMIEDSFDNADNDIYAHYCSLESFLAFFKDYSEGKTIERRCLSYTGRPSDISKKIPYVTFFASNLTFLNDSKEFNLGKTKVTEAMGTIPEDSLNKEIYIACFCSNDDYLTQWKYYGKNSGLAVVFDTKDVYLNYYEDEYDSVEGTGDMKFIPRNVIYKDYENRICDIKNQYTKDLKQASEVDIAQVTVPFIKDEYFIDENESRIALYNIKDKGNLPLSRSQYRVSSNKIIPQLKLKLFCKNGSNKLPIKSIVIGPGDDQELIMDAVCNILSPVEGYENIAGGNRKIRDLDIVVKKSKCPFKG